MFCFQLTKTANLFSVNHMNLFIVISGDSQRLGLLILKKEKRSVIIKINSPEYFLLPWLN